MKKQPAEIIGIQFSTMSPEEIRRNSVLEITSRDTFVNNKPVVGGLFDPRMGTIDRDFICPTDKLSYMDSPGYFGHIELARPVFYTQHMKEIIKILRCVCFKCSKLLIDKSDHKHALNMLPEARWRYVSGVAAKVKRCTAAGCGCKKFDKIQKDSMNTVFVVWDSLKKGAETLPSVQIRLTAEIVLKIFRRISNEDCHFMGFNPVFSRPENMVCEVLAVPPPAVRPSVKHDANQRSEDDLTQIFAFIIKTNNDLKERIKANAPAHVIDSYVSFLQYYISSIEKNKVKGATGPITQRTGRPLQCISDRLNSKGGRIRGNLMGKRVDFSARSVITGDPSLSIRQLGVPMKIAKNLTKPVVVNDRNRDFLTRLVQNGPDVFPGAKSVDKKNGNNISLRFAGRSSVVLENGDVVNRHLMDGDCVLFNRQPSLHRMSMMGHIVKVMKSGDSFRMNVACTKPYNADYDGDEMNMHVAQNAAAEIELQQLAAVPFQMVSPSSNAPIIGIFQDSLLGANRITRENVYFTPRDVMNLLMRFPAVNPTKIRAAGDKISSFEVISQIMPPLTLKYKTKLFDDSPTEDPKTSNHVLEIRRGQYLRGQIEKGVFGSGTKGLLQRICNDFGNMACADFIDNIQHIVNEYMKTSSFSVGIGDLIADAETQAKITAAIAAQKRDVQDILDRVHLGIFENNTANTNQAELEMQVNKILNKATEEAGKIGHKNLSKDNRFVTIVKCGSKGSALNIAQMISCLGQTNVDGKRIQYGFDNRTLPHFHKFDDSPEARGFIENSYIQGLKPTHLFFHAMGGRIGLIDTAVKTSQTGYIQRKLIKGMEDLKMEYDYTVRNNRGKIVQFKYGDDNTDSTRVENQNIPLVGMSLEDIYLHYDVTNQADLKVIYTKDAAALARKQLVETKKKCADYIERMIEYRAMLVEKVFRHKDESGVRCPVAFQYIIANIQGQLELGANSLLDITPLEAFRAIEENFVRLRKLNYAAPNLLFEIMYYFYLTPRDLLIVKRFNRAALQLLLDNINLAYKRALVHPGEMVGVVAGQSLGEPTTQLTLNTFHNSGISSKSNVTRGVPRIDEIIRITNSPDSRSLTVYLPPAEETNMEKAKQYTHMLEHTKLVNLVKSVQICFDPDDRQTTMKEDELWLRQFHEFEKMVDECAGAIPELAAARRNSYWVLRLEMDGEVMLDKNISMDDVHFAIKNYNPALMCSFTDYNADNLVFRLRLDMEIARAKKRGANQYTLDQTDEIYMLNTFQEQLLNSVVLRGVSGITAVSVRKLQDAVVYKDGKYTRQDSFVLDTTGSNLMQVLALDFIDSRRTFSNDIYEMWKVLGVEACRTMIYNELQEVMEFSGAYVNSHHVHLLADRMTCSKDLTPIYRTNIMADNIGPLAKATFEMHTEVLLNAARHGSFDPMRGISANVMTGQTGHFGTSAFGVVLDMSEMANLEPTEDAAAAAAALARPRRGAVAGPKAAAAAAAGPCEAVRLDNNLEYMKPAAAAATAACMPDDEDNVGI